VGLATPWLRHCACCATVLCVCRRCVQVTLSWLRHAAATTAVPRTRSLLQNRPQQSNRRVRSQTQMRNLCRHCHQTFNITFPRCTLAVRPTSKYTPTHLHRLSNQLRQPGYLCYWKIRLFVYKIRMLKLKQETQLSLINRATHLCKCNGVADFVKTCPSHVFMLPCRIWSFSVKRYERY